MTSKNVNEKNYMQKMHLEDQLDQ
jgi:hypothetical protein